MNNCCHIGRAVKKATVNYTQGSKPMCIARFTLAVDRRFKRDGQPTADFPNFVAFGKQGEFCEKYVDKGVKFAVVSHVQTGSYEKDGQKVFTTDFIVDSIEFAESKASQQSQGEAHTEQTAPAQTNVNNGQGIDSFMQIPDAIDEEVPFS